MNVAAFRFLGRVAPMLAALVLTACPGEAEAPRAPASPPPVEKGARLAVPAQGAYVGAYIDFGEKEDEVTLEAIEKFEKLVGKRNAIVASSSYWGEQTFPTANVELIARHGAVPLVFWSPWDRPYNQQAGPDKYSVTSILAGKHDAYIDRWADAAKAYGRPMFLSFCNEMNGTWFPWSGWFYGAGARVPPAKGEKSGVPRYMGPETWKKMYRRVVDRVRARGATNIIWTLHVMNYPYPVERWNWSEQYYPGDDYVDWIGMSVYGAQFRGDDWSAFTPLLAYPYRQLRAIAPSKPVMICEWGVAELPNKGDRGAWITEAFNLMKDPSYDRIKAIIFWHERWPNKDGSHSNLRVNSSPGALKAYREGVADPHWLDRPQFEK